MARVHADLQWPCRADLDLIGSELQRRGEFVDELFGPLCQRDMLGVRRFAPRQLQDIVDDLTDPPRVLTDDVEQPALGVVGTLRLLQELAGMTERADRVADFVRDARTQAAERGELGLLDLFREQARVLEKDQHRPVGTALERCDIRVDPRRPAGRDEALRFAECALTAAPVQQYSLQCRRHRLQRLAGLGRACPEVLGGRLIDQPDVS